MGLVDLSGDPLAGKCGRGFASGLPLKVAVSSIKSGLRPPGYFSWLCALDSFYIIRRGEQSEDLRFCVWLKEGGVGLGSAAKLLLFPHFAIGLADYNRFYFLSTPPVGGFGDLDLFLPFWKSRTGSVYPKAIAKLWPRATCTTFLDFSDSMISGVARGSWSPWPS